MRFRVIATVLTVLLSACALHADRGQESSPSPSPTPSPAPFVSPAPRATEQSPAPPLLTPSTNALPAATPPPATAVPGATLPASGVVTPSQQAESAPPQIVDLHLDKTVVQSGEVVSGMVLTSLNTASVEARIGGYGISVPKVGAGRFAIKYTVPSVPFFLKRTYDMVVIARNTAGVKTQRTVSITIR